MLAKLAEALGAEGVSISEMSQPSHQGAQAEILIVTHPCQRSALDAALTNVEAQGLCMAPAVALRIERV